MGELEIRPARLQDAAAMFEMMRGLAEYVGELEHFTACLKDVERDAFGDNRRYESLIGSLNAQPAALATYFFTYSTYTGRPCLFVLDLFVSEAARGRQMGRAMMRQLSRIALDNGCCRIDLHVHKHNPARDFYSAIGLAQSPERPYVLSGENLARLARD